MFIYSKIFFIWNHKTDSIRSDGNHWYSYDEFPIDVVYTWVNGTDPKLVTQLSQTRRDIYQSIQREFEDISNNECLRQTHITCESSDAHNCLETPIVFITPQITNPHNLFNNVIKFVMTDTRGTLIYFSTLLEGIECLFWSSD